MGKNSCEMPTETFFVLIGVTKHNIQKQVVEFKYDAHIVSWYKYANYQKCLEYKWRNKYNPQIYVCIC